MKMLDIVIGDTGVPVESLSMCDCDHPNCDIGCDYDND
jgi:hypothetical protein